MDGLTVDHNTVFHSGTIVNLNGPNTSATQTTSFVFKNNLLTHNLYGFKSSYYGEGDDTINNKFPGHLLQRNVLAGANPNLFTANSCPSPLNCYPSSINSALFVDRANGDYRLASIQQLQVAPHRQHRDFADAFQRNRRLFAGRHLRLGFRQRRRDGRLS
ncbi:MAG TPA: hypothetical protein VEZ40_10645 [Pyrinomonadaceae bacterium]|nr:hypothetical protein [Pyrinomonadaceae bacterium]